MGNLSQLPYLQKFSKKKNKNETLHIASKNLAICRQFGEDDYKQSNYRRSSILGLRSSERFEYYGANFSGHSSSKQFFDFCRYSGDFDEDTTDAVTKEDHQHWVSNHLKDLSILVLILTSFV